MIDLSFLTEEEQESILAVLKRDAELKSAELERIQNLQRTSSDKERLKYMTGEWFYETKQLRHQDRIHGSDIIRASMRHVQRPMTIQEISCSVPEKPSFVSSENKEVFVPPVLQGVLQEPGTEPSEERDRHENMSPENEPSPVLQSPTKERKNPFNSDIIESFVAEEVSEAVTQTLTLDEEPLSSCDDLSQLDELGGKQTTSAAPRSILKHLSPSSSSDSLFPRLVQQTLVSLDCPSESWIDRKQVRFSSMVSHSAQDLQDRRELGEHSLLDVDFISEGVDQPDVGLHGAAFGSEVISLEEELNSKNEAIVLTRDDASGLCYLESLSPAVSGLSGAQQESGKPVHLDSGPEEALDAQPTTSDQFTLNSDIDAASDPVSSQPGQSVLGDREEEELPSQQEEVNLYKQEEPANSHLLSQDAAETTTEKHSAVRTLQLTALQNTPFKEQETPADTSTEVQSPERLSNLKAFWERENRAPKTVFAWQETGLKDFNKTGKEAELDVESANNNLSPHMVTTVERTAPASQEKCSLPQPSWSHLVVLSEEDGTYRANPVLIYEEADDTLTSYAREPETSENQENTNTPEKSSLPFNSQKQERDPPDPPPQEERRAKISDLKNFWEKEVTKSKENAASASRGSSRRGKVFSPQTSQRSFSYSKERSDGGEVTSPTKTRSNTVIRSVDVSGKGFVSPHRSPLKSSEPKPSRDLQTRDEADTETLTSPLSPKRSPTPQAKDQDEETRKSPSKTCHPRVLPRETSSPQSPRLEGSPLKTFPIDIDPQAKNGEEPQWRPTPTPRQRKSPAHEAKQTALSETKPSSDTMTGDVNTQQSGSKSPSKSPSRSSSKSPTRSSSRSSSKSPSESPSKSPLKSPSESPLKSPSPQLRKTSEKKLNTITRLARSIIPQDYQHYLGPSEKAHVPPFTLNSDEPQSPHKSPRSSAGILKNSPQKSIEQNVEESSSQDIMICAFTVSQPRPGSRKETPTIVISSPKIESHSRSLESLTSKTGEENSLDLLKYPTNQSVEDVSSLPSSSDSKQLKSFASAPLLQQDETDSDSTFETLGLRRNTGSSMSNLSLSSGLASMSSVSGSISSIYPADIGDIEVQGSIQFAVNYIQKLGEFHIFVVHCRDLAVADLKKNRSDPYIKCYLLPDKTKLGKRKTAVKKKTFSPDYNEILRFKVPMDVLKTQNLNISVWHNDTFGRNSFLGDVDLDLSEWDFSNTHINEYALNARVSAQTSSPTHPQLTDSRGQIRVALRFLLQTPSGQSSSKVETSEVQIWVKDCKNLPAVRGVVIDPFVKCTVLPDNSRKSRQKTRVVKRSANPMFNHTMVYDGFRPEDLREACAELTVWDHDRLNNHYIGGVRLGQGAGKSYGVDVGWMDSTPDEAHLWQRMLRAEGEWVEDVLPLRLLVMAKSMSK
ncbi:uncharacterized protein sytl2a [Halichoeres trimaculatus]|uniref:uncharacterized protein sytl2a n=1 Tax=Halichoeres trimaculatus TaxID=147232 RepID=UPI003D9E9140